MENFKKTELIKIKDNKVYTTSRDIAKMFGKRHDSVLRDIRNMVKNNSEIKDEITESYYYDNRNRRQTMFIISQLLMNSFKQKDKITKNHFRLEHSIRDKIIDYFDLNLCDIEVKTPAGLIDILTTDYIIEVKKISNWKSGIGQLFSYKYFYRGKKLHLILFLNFKNIDKNKELISIIKKVCKSLKIKISFFFYIEKDNQISIEGV